MPKHDPILAALGRNVRRQRDAKTFTQEKLAEKSGLDPTYISDIERGLQPSTLNSLCDPILFSANSAR
jgi:transcriptional regulator with XRE-family HTH domain